PSTGRLRPRRAKSRARALAWTWRRGSGSGAPGSGARAGIWRRPRDETRGRPSGRRAQNLLGGRVALPRASAREPGARLGAAGPAQGGPLAALAGPRPERGDERPWMARGVLGGAVPAAASLRQAPAPVLAALLRPIEATGLPVLGGSGAARGSIRL